MARPRGQGSMPTGGNGGGKSTPQNDKACAALNKRVEDARNYLPPRLTNTSAWDNPKLLKAYQDSYRSNAEEWEERKSVVSGKSVSERIELGGHRNLKKKKKTKQM